MDFTEPSGRNPIWDWLLDQETSVRAKIQDRLLNWESMPQSQWSSNSNWIKKYHSLDDIFELRIPFNRVQYRPLGWWGPERRQFTILMGAIEKDSKIPKPDLDTAVRRKKILEAEPHYAKRHKYG